MLQIFICQWKRLFCICKIHQCI